MQWFGRYDTIRENGGNMLTLMQLLNVIKEPLDRQLLLEWCQLIAEDSEKVYMFNDDLFDNHGIELSEVQMERLVLVCQNGKYKSAFEVAKLENS